MENISEKIIPGNFPNLGNETDILLSTQQTKRSFQTIRPFSAPDLHWLHISLRITKVQSIVI